MGTILLFYKYTEIKYPKKVMKWQRQICQDLDLTGRILIAHEGINATLGGSKQNVARYKKIMQENSQFADIDFKESQGDTSCFPKLQVTVKKEIVCLGLDEKTAKVENTGIHLTPEQVHELLENKPDDLVVLDARNYFEAKIGKFENAITPKVDHFRDFPQYIDQHLDEFKDKQVLMYCTGGIRCERATAYLKEKNVAKDVYQILGGIHRYAEKYPDGFFRGKNYVFDSRVAIKVTDDILGNCRLCKASCDEYTNCLNVMCNRHFICCNTCLKKMNNTCSQKCLDYISISDAHKRPLFKRYAKSNKSD